MHHNYCLKRKQHSYEACDAALAASICILVKDTAEKEIVCYGISAILRVVIRCVQEGLMNDKILWH